MIFIELPLSNKGFSPVNVFKNVVFKHVLCLNCGYIFKSTVRSDNLQTLLTCTCYFWLVPSINFKFPRS